MYCACFCCLYYAVFFCEFLLYCWFSSECLLSIFCAKIYVLFFLFCICSYTIQPYLFERFDLYKILFDADLIHTMLQSCFSGKKTPLSTVKPGAKVQKLLMIINQPIFSSSRSRSATMEMNSLLVGFPFVPETVNPKYS